jgi:myo-inositol catabolism protein IolC
MKTYLKLKTLAIIREDRQATLKERRTILLNRIALRQSQQQDIELARWLDEMYLHGLSNRFSF